MIRIFCDLCGVEISQKDLDGRGPVHRLGATLKKGNCELTVQVIETKGGVSNTGHFCRYCVLDALNKLDDRPRAGPPE